MSKATGRRRPQPEIVSRRKSAKSSKSNPYANIQLPICDPNAIRLLEIVPSRTRKGSGGIACRLRIGSLDEPYVALSYMWGVQPPDKTILLNGVPFRIRKNLWEFLWQERVDQAAEGPRLLWIDALCIHQESILERNHQVALMGEIYTKAVKVMVWLGEESEKLAVWKYFDDFDSDNPPPLKQGLWDSVSEEWKPQHAAGLEFCKHEYWSRAWIFQECVLAAEIEVKAGSHRVSESTLQKACEFWSTDLSQYYAMSADYPGLHVLEARWGWHDASGKRYFCPWASGTVQLRPTFACSDPRDRIFSVIALMDPIQKIVPDYNKTAPELFVAVVEQFGVEGIGMLVLAHQLDLIKRDLRPEDDSVHWTDQFGPTAGNALKQKMLKLYHSND